MSNTKAGERLPRRAFVAAASAVAATLSTPARPATSGGCMTMVTPGTLPPKQQAIGPIAAAAALGDMPSLHAALGQGLDAGLTVSETKEILIQLYAYAGFPRSLNALGELLKVLDARRQRGVHDAPGHGPRGAIPTGKELLALGTANQTKLVGTPVRGALFEFAPAIDEYLKTHLFGDIFARDNLDWQSRELATVGVLAALPDLESQLQSHARISLHVGLSAEQLRHFADVLGQRGQPDAARRVREALERVLEDSAKRSARP